MQYSTLDSSCHLDDVCWSGTLYTKQMMQHNCALEKPYFGVFTFLIMHVNLDFEVFFEKHGLKLFFHEYVFIVQTLQPSDKVFGARHTEHGRA